MLRQDSVISGYLHLIFRADSLIRFLKSMLFALGLSRGVGPAEIRFHRGVMGCAAVLVLFILCILPLPVAHAATVTLAWNSNSEPDLEGYVVYWNEDYAGPPYDYSDTLPEDDLDDPLHPKVKLTGLKKDSTYHIALTAYDTEGNESDFSREICVQVVNDIIELCSQSVGPVTGSSSSSGGSGGGGGGGACFISSALHNPPNDRLVQGILFTLAIICMGISAAKRRQKKGKNN